MTSKNGYVTSSLWSKQSLRRWQTAVPMQRLLTYPSSKGTTGTMRHMILQIVLITTFQEICGETTAHASVCLKPDLCIITQSNHKFHHTWWCYNSVPRRGWATPQQLGVRSCVQWYCTKYLVILGICCSAMALSSTRVTSATMCLSYTSDKLILYIIIYGNICIKYYCDIVDSHYCTILTSFNLQAMGRRICEPRLWT